jgi:hypothetical protein
MIYLYTKYNLNPSNHHWENVIIMSVTDGQMDGRTDGEPDGHRHTIIRPVFNGRIKTFFERNIFSFLLDLKAHSKNSTHFFFFFTLSFTVVTEFEKRQCHFIPRDLCLAINAVIFRYKTISSWMFAVFHLIARIN